MITSDRVSWLLALVCCVIIPQALGYYALALAGGGSLAVLAWVLRRD